MSVEEKGATPVVPGTLNEKNDATPQGAGRFIKQVAAYTESRGYKMETFSMCGDPGKVRSLSVVFTPVDSETPAEPETPAEEEKSDDS